MKLRNQEITIKILIKHPMLMTNLKSNCSITYIDFLEDNSNFHVILETISELPEINSDINEASSNLNTANTVFAFPCSSYTFTKRYALMDQNKREQCIIESERENGNNKSKEREVV